MNIVDKVAVCSKSFSKNIFLRNELLKKYKHVKFNDAGENLFGESLIEFLQSQNKAIIGLEEINESILKKLPKLDVIGKYGVGLDKIDLLALNKFKIRLGWVGGVNRRSVSEMVISFAVGMLRHFPRSNQDVKNGIWDQNVGRLLSGRTVGIIGCGFIGKDLIKLLKPWDCKILANDIRNYNNFYKQYGVISSNLENLLKQSDVVSLHVPLDNSTKNILSTKRLKLMKENAVLINAARGNLVDEKCLKKMLIEGKLAAAAFDVFSIEPPTDLELLNLPNFLATPHIGGSAEDVIIKMGLSAIKGLENNFIPPI